MAQREQDPRENRSAPDVSKSAGPGQFMTCKRHSTNRHELSEIHSLNCFLRCRSTASERVLTPPEVPTHVVVATQDTRFHTCIVTRNN
eukprot:701301-Rhodomonas_salina.5